MGYTRLQRMRALRRQALELISRGAAHSEIAAELGVTRAVVWKWSKQGSAADSATVQAYALNAEVLARLPAVIEGGAGAYGFANDNWTNARITVMFEIEFGMCLTPVQAFHLLGGLVPGSSMATPVLGVGTGDSACQPIAPAPL